MKILIAEDDPISRRILEATLVKWGYEVSVTLDGRQAWDVLQREDAPSLAILDIMMPGMDGLEICRKVRQLPCATPPYLILLSAMSAKEQVVTGIRAGANDYLTKPFHRDELRVRVGVGVQMLCRKPWRNAYKSWKQRYRRSSSFRGCYPSVLTVRKFVTTRTTGKKWSTIFQTIPMFNSATASVPIVMSV